jgi:protein-S-isoprenylcysteine O-methyltransferase Ste14
MPEKSSWEKLLERAPLAVIVIGVIVFIIGAAGGLPLGNPPLQVTDLSWRVGLGAMGLILAAVGLLLLVREERNGLNKRAARASKSFLAKTYPRS